MIPKKVKSFLLKQKEGNGCYCIAINDKHLIIQCFGNPGLVGVSAPTFNMPIFEFLPILVTETFEEDFEIPFYNVNDDYVCNIYFLKLPKVSYLILVDRSEIFQVTQKYQQFAHDDNISKNKFKRLAEELDKAKHSLKKSNQEKATLIAMLSHELGTPLTSIIGYSELLIKGGSNIKSGLETIHRNALYLQHMIENTLMFGKTESGGVQTNLESTSVAVLFSDIFVTLLPAVQKKKLKLIIDKSCKDFINIDVTLCKQVLINLINNAIKYTEEGSVELKYSLVKKHYVFSVIDTGLGVAKDLQEQIFSPWERIEENSESGTGIGLFISRKLAHSMGGDIKLKYSSKEFGSIFQLILPVKDLPVVETFDRKALINNISEKSLLVIDDDYDILILIEAMLATSELKVHTAVNFTEAQTLLENEEIDLVLTDYNLGSVKASSFLETIKNKYDLPVLLMSALPSNCDKNNYLTLGFDDVITKPLSVENLLNIILTHIQR